MKRALPSLLALACGCACAQVPNVFDRQQGGTYIEPPARVDPQYVPEAPDHSQQDSAPARLTLALTLDLPLRRGGTASLGRSVQGSTAASPTLQAALQWRPIAGSYWFARAVFYRYLQPDRQQAWHPDFSYAFGYEDFRPGTWSFSYANYTGTRFRPDRALGEHRFNFPEGLWSADRRFALPAPLEPALLVGDGDAANCDAGAHYMPRYVDLASGEGRRGKTSLSLGCRYTRPGGWYAELTLYGWPQGAQEQPWDPDYTYGFGWEGWLDPGRLAIRYNNHSGNRFPGRALGAGEGRFTSGSVSASWSADW